MELLWSLGLGAWCLSVLLAPAARGAVTLTTLHSFSGPEGANPVGLIQGADGDFYGRTEYGGVDYNGRNQSGNGTIFQVTLDGTLTSLFSSNRTNGANPHYGPLVHATDGNFYGTTYGGGTGNKGTVFRLSITPTPPAFQTVTRTAEGLNFTWSALAGHSYQLQFTTDLAQTNWTSSGSPISATNTTATASDAIMADRQRFYRVVLLP